MLCLYAHQSYSAELSALYSQTDNIQALSYAAHTLHYTTVYTLHTLHYSSSPAVWQATGFADWRSFDPLRLFSTVCPEYLDRPTSARTGGGQSPASDKKSG